MKNLLDECFPCPHFIPKPCHARLPEEHDNVTDFLSGKVVSVPSMVPCLSRQTVWFDTVLFASDQVNYYLEYKADYWLYCTTLFDRNTIMGLLKSRKFDKPHFRKTGPKQRILDNLIDPARKVNAVDLIEQINNLNIRNIKLLLENKENIFILLDLRKERQTYIFLSQKFRLLTVGQLNSRHESADNASNTRFYAKGDFILCKIELSDPAAG